jgi:hypothetical protein
VLNIGHVPKNRTIPTSETRADQTASARHHSPRPNQKAPAATTKPTSETIQNVLATSVAVPGASDGTSHERAAVQAPVLLPGRSWIQAMAPRAPPCPRPCKSRTPAKTILVI